MIVSWRASLLPCRSRSLACTNSRPLAPRLHDLALPHRCRRRFVADPHQQAHERRFGADSLISRRLLKTPGRARLLALAPGTLRSQDDRLPLHNVHPGVLPGLVCPGRKATGALGSAGASPRVGRNARTSGAPAEISTASAAIPPTSATTHRSRRFPLRPALAAAGEPRSGPAPLRSRALAAGSRTADKGGSGGMPSCRCSRASHWARRSATSFAELKRSAGLLACSRSMIVHSHSGTSGMISGIGRGVSSATRFSTASVFAARNGGRPLHMTYKTLPRLKRSARWSIF